MVPENAFGRRETVKTVFQLRLLAGFDHRTSGPVELPGNRIAPQPSPSAHPALILTRQR